MIQTLFPAQKQFINKCQNLVSFTTLSSVLYFYFVDRIEPCHHILFSYLSVDLLFAEPELMIHHVMCLLTLSCKNAFNFTQEESNYIIKPFVKTEISTIFLIFKVFYENNASDRIKQNRIANTLYKINDLIFITTFIKTRVWDLLFDAMLNPEIHNKTIDKSDGSIITNAHLYVGFLGLYAINLYWFSIMCRKIYKDLVVKTRFAWIDTVAIAEQILPWTMFLCFVPYVPHLLLYNGNINILYDFAGAIILSFASYNYHGKKRDIINSGNAVLIANNVFVNGLNDADNDASTEFFFNAGAIHLKSFLSLIAIGSDRGWSSFVLHFICFVGSHLYSLSHIRIDDTSIKQMNVLNLCTMAPSLYDLGYIIATVDDRVTQIQIGIIAAAIIIVVKIKPLYNMNDVVVHLLAILQTWSIVSAIVEK